MGQAVVLVLEAVVGLGILQLDPALWGLGGRTIVYLVSIYLSMILTLRASERNHN